MKVAFAEPLSILAALTLLPAVSVTTGAVPFAPLRPEPGISRTCFEPWKQTVDTVLAHPIKGWSIIESLLQEFQVGLDQTIKHTGSHSGYIKSTSPVPTAGVLRQTILSDPYRGRRVRFSGFLKGEQVEGWAGLWMRVDGENAMRLSMDNMKDRPIKGTVDWKHCEIVLDVPAESIAIAFGFFLAGKGQVWADEFSLQPVGPEIGSTEIYGKNTQSMSTAEQRNRHNAYAKWQMNELHMKPLNPVNLNFDDPIR